MPQWNGSRINTLASVPISETGTAERRRRVLGLARALGFLLGMRPSMAGAALLMLASLFEVATGQAGCPTQTKVRLSLLRTGPRSWFSSLRAHGLWSEARGPSHTRRLPAVLLPPPPPHAVRGGLDGNVRLRNDGQVVARQALDSLGASKHLRHSYARAPEVASGRTWLAAVGGSKLPSQVASRVLIVSCLYAALWPPRCRSGCDHER